ncbi:TIGR03089 family protein [Actinomadura atramentaria]|uniref:TIGR03089 family protein n=1 Tax=Actinomadura atramentaria TaxID=1990 RepID=UPI000360621F|nr:TIGR03089 family protein [Actinomadura atramentaria]
MTDARGPEPRTPAELLRRRVADDPSRPLVTFYDDASGERVELSARTFDNWVAKTANLLVDELGAGPGGIEHAVLVLPPHWQSAVWLMACWSAGVAVRVVDPADGVAGDPPDAPFILAAAEEVLADVADGPLGSAADELVGLSLHALGGPLAAAPPGVTDYAVEVRAHGDRFTPPPGVGPQTSALTVTKVTLTAGELVAEAARTVDKWGLDSQDRLLVAMSFATLEGLLASLLAPLVSGASVIIQRNFDKAALDRRLTLEHVTAMAGVPEPNDASGSVHRLA